MDGQGPVLDKALVERLWRVVGHFRGMIFHTDEPTCH